MTEASRPLRLWHRIPAVPQAALLAAAYLVLALLAAQFMTRDDDVVTFWPSSGLAVAALAVSNGRRCGLCVVAIVLASLAFSAIDGDPAGRALAFAAADAVVAALAATAIRLALGHRRPDLSQFPDLGAFAGAAALGCAVGALIAAAHLSSGDAVAFGTGWVTWAMGNLTGIVVVAPLILGMPNDGRRPPLQQRPAEGAAAIGLSLVLAVVIFSLTEAPLVGFVMLPVIWAALRVGVVGATLAMAAVAVVILAATSDGRGMFAATGATPSDDVLIAQSVLVLCALVAVALAALTIERERQDDRLRRREDELRRMQRLDSLGALAGSVAHDFNNVLAVIRGHAERGLARAGPAEEDLRMVLRAVQSGSALAHQLLRVGAGRSDPPGEVDLNALVADMHGLLSRVLGARWDVELDLDDGAGLVVADPVQLEQVLLNLVVNARDAMPDGGRLTIGTQALPGAQTAIVVCDTGPGMDAETLRHARDRGFTTKTSGSGLGLATVRDVAERHHGRLELDSAPGEGTTARVILPRAGTLEFDVQPEPEEQPEPVVPAAEGERTVLLAEDSPHVRALIRLALSESGLDLLEARDGEHALEVADRHAGDIDLLVTDITMPGLDGPDLFRRLRERRPGLRVLYVSGNPEDAPREHGVDEGAVLAKPFALADLTARVHAALDRRARV